MNRKGRTFVGILILLATMLEVGCGVALFRDYGKTLPSGDVTGAFVRHEIDPDLNYYISGSDLYPNAILGLKKTHVLESGLWKRVELTSESLRTLVTDMQSRASWSHDFLHGSVILDNEGRPIGIWYSLLSARTAVRIKGDGSVAIPTPALNTYERGWKMGEPLIPSTR
jgi:hypothetical protein